MVFIFMMECAIENFFCSIYSVYLMICKNLYGLCQSKLNKIKTNAKKIHILKR